jgi:small-conductance mechanosensitive channel
MARCSGTRLTSAAGRRSVGSGNGAIALWLGLLIFLLAAPPVASGQEASPAAGAHEVSRDEEIVAGLEWLERELKTVEGAVEPDASIEQIDAQLGERAGHLTAEARADLVRLAKLDPAKLQDVTERWKEEQVRLEKWDQMLRQRAQACAADLQRLDDLEARWRRTLADAQGSGAPAALTGQIDAALNDLEVTRKRARDRQAQLNALDRRVVDQAALVSDVLEASEGMQRGLLSSLLERDQPPLWDVRRVAGQPPPSDAVRASLVARGQTLSQYAAEHSQLVPALVALWVASLAIVLMFGRSASRWTGDDEDLRAAAQVLRRPISTSLLLWTILTPFPYPGSPPVIRQVMVGLLIVPFFRTISPLLGPLRPLFYSLLGVMVADRVRYVLDALPLVSRSLLLVETHAALGVLLAARRRLGLIATPDVRRWIESGLRVPLIALVVSLAANALGYLRLATMLAEGTIRGAYAAMFAYALVRILGAVVVVSFQSRPLSKLRLVEHYHATLVRRVRRFLAWFVATLWTILVLGLFGLRDLVLGAAGSALTTPLSIGRIELTLGDLVAFGLTVWAAIALSRLVRTLLEEEVLSRFVLPRGVPYAISTFASYAVLLTGFFLALAAAGVGFERVFLFTGALGVGIGLGLQGIVNDLVSGVVLLFERPVQIGDTVQIGELTGEVRHIGLRASVIRTWEGAEVIVPNAKLTSTQVINWTLSDRRRRIDLPVGVAYGTDPERAIAILLEVASRHAAVLRDPPPTALFVGFGASSLDLTLRAWTDQFDDYFKIRSELAVGVIRALDDAGIAIPFPHREVRLIDSRG